MNEISITALRLFVCIAAAGIALYAYIDKTNELTELRIAIPMISKALDLVEEENKRLQYQISQFESPIHLMELQRKPEFSHLKYPYLNEIVILPED